MDVIQLVIRLLAFGVTLFLLLEFIVFCKVNTITALFALIVTIMVVVFIFVFFKRYDMHICKECMSKVPKSMFKMQKV